MLGFDIGRHSDPAVAGYPGAKDRYEYPVVRGTTNVAAHLCALADAGQVIINQATLERIGERALAIETGRVRLKRRREMITIYELLGLSG